MVAGTVTWAAVGLGERRSERRGTGQPHRFPDDGRSGNGTYDGSTVRAGADRKRHDMGAQARPANGTAASVIARAGGRARGAWRRAVRVSRRGFTIVRNEGAGSLTVRVIDRARARLVASSPSIVPRQKIGMLVRYEVQSSM